MKRVSKNMISLLERVRAGLIRPTDLNKFMSTKRAITLQIVTDCEIEDVHTGGVNCLDLDPSEHRYLLSGAKDGGICVHDLLNYYGKSNYTAKVLFKIERSNPAAHKFSLESIQWYPFDSGLFVSSGMDSKVKLWDSNMMTMVHESAMEGKIYHHEMSKVPSQNYLVAVASSTKNVAILDLKSGSKSHELAAHACGVLSCHWSPRDDALLATGGCDNQVLLWDIRSAKSCLKSLDQHNGKGNFGKLSSITAHDGFVNGLRFTENGFFLVSYGSDNKLKVWDVVKGTNVMVNFGTTYNSSKCSIQFDVTSGENELVFVPSEHKIIAYEVMSGRRVKTLSGHFGGVNCCIFEPWFQQLFSGGKDCAILSWTSAVQEMGASNAASTGSGMTFNENWDD